MTGLHAVHISDVNTVTNAREIGFYRLKEAVFNDLCEFAGQGHVLWWHMGDLQKYVFDMGYSWGWTVIFADGSYYRGDSIVFYFTDSRHATYFKLKWGGDNCHE